jgi:hypothetical protein
MRRLVLGVVLVAVALTAVSAHPSRALAHDDVPCERPPFRHHGQMVQYCALWRGDVPVTNSQGRQSGTLVEGGRANWFVCQIRLPDRPFRLGPYANDWWAVTLSDDGHWGLVSLVYFEGGDNFKPDAGLRH